MADPDDVNVDELKRRARRRLVGAVVLALAAAVFVPLLLESDPKPLGEDVSVRIPPVDDGKFVNRLNDGAKSESARPAAGKGDQAKTDAAKTEPSKPDARGADGAPAKDTTTSAASATAPAKKPPGDAEPKMPGAPPGATTATAPAAKGTSATSAAPAPATTNADAKGESRTDAKSDGAGAFSVQLAAFSDDKGANALSNKLKKAGYPAYTEPLTTSKGTLWRVRVGPYASRDAATTSRDKLKGEGYNGIVASAN
jgi:DedD protein